MFVTPSRPKRKREGSGRGGTKKTRRSSVDANDSGFVERYISTPLKAMISSFIGSPQSDRHISSSDSELVSDSDFSSSEEASADLSSDETRHRVGRVVIEISSDSDSSASESEEEDYATSIRRREFYGSRRLVDAASDSFIAGGLPLSGGEGLRRLSSLSRVPIDHRSSSRFRLDESDRRQEREQLLGAIDARLAPYLAQANRRRAEAEREVDTLFEDDWRLRDLSEDSAGAEDEAEWRRGAEELEREPDAGGQEEWQAERDYATTLESMDGRLPDFSELQPFRERRKLRDRVRKMERAALKRAAFGDEDEGVGRAGRDVFGDSYDLDSLFSHEHSLSVPYHRSVGVAALAQPPTALVEERRRQARAAAARDWGEGEGMAGYRALQDRVDAPMLREKQMGTSLQEVQRRVGEYQRAKHEREALIEQSKRKLQERAMAETERRRLLAEAQAERKARLAAAARRKKLQFTAEERKHLRFALHSAPKTKAIVKGFGTTLTRDDFERMRDREWLNDEIVNFYFELLKERQARDDFAGARCHFFNTFFYPLLTSGPHKYNYKRVQKWTRRIDLFTLDKVIIPIHLGVHWCLAVINLKDQRFEYYDSLGSSNPACLRTMRRYFEDEARTKEKTLDLSTWSDHQPFDIPKQRNSWDCGVFTCKYADCASRNVPFGFHQDDMKYYRNRIALDVILKFVPNAD